MHSAAFEETSSNGEHRLTVVCRSAVGAVAQCSCGHLHLDLQYMTLRFEPAAFQELLRMLAHAQRRLDEQPSLPRAPGPDIASVH